MLENGLTFSHTKMSKVFQFWIQSRKATFIQDFGHEVRSVKLSELFPHSQIDPELSSGTHLNSDQNIFNSVKVASGQKWGPIPPH